MRGVLVLAAVLIGGILTGAVVAQPVPTETVKPRHRPTEITPTQPVVKPLVRPAFLGASKATDDIAKPLARPQAPFVQTADQAKPASRPKPRPVLVASHSLSTSPRPMPRPMLGLALAKPQQTEAPPPGAPITPDAAPLPAPKQTKRGSVCGIRAIRGEAVARITSKTKGCGINDPVRVTEIDGIRLTPAATINCNTAKALHDWINQSVEPVFGAGQVVGFQVAASYSCRGRNNVKGARISEHGKGNAIDIAGFFLADGNFKTVAKNYDKSLRKVHKGACGIFGTTLGPGSDGYHENHIHLDVARYRSGTYCR